MRIITTITIDTGEAKFAPGEIVELDDKEAEGILARFGGERVGRSKPDAAAKAAADAKATADAKAKADAEAADKAEQERLAKEEADAKAAGGTGA